MLTKALVGLVLVLVISAPAAFARKWTDSTGTYTVEAEFVGVTDGKVRLKKADGKTIAIPIEKLSQEDQAFLNQPAPGKPDAEQGTISLDHIDTPHRSLGKYLLDAGATAGALVVKVGAPDVAPGADPGVVKALFGDPAERLRTVMLLEGPIPVQLLKDKFGDPTETRGNDGASRDFGAIWQARRGNSPLPKTATEWVYGNIVLLVQGDSASWWGVRRVATVQAKNGEKGGPKDNQKQVQLGLRLFKWLTYHKTDSVLSTQNDIDAVVFSRNVATEALKKDSRGNVVLSVVQAIAKRYPKAQLQVYFVSQEPVALDALKAAVGDPDSVQAGMIEEEGVTIPVSWHKYGAVEFAVTVGKIVVLRATTIQQVHVSAREHVQDNAEGNAAESQPDNQPKDSDNQGVPITVGDWSVGESAAQQEKPATPHTEPLGTLPQELPSGARTNGVEDILAKWRAIIPTIPDEFLVVYVEASRMLMADNCDATYTFKSYIRDVPGDLPPGVTFHRDTIGAGVEVRLESPPPPEVLGLMEEKLKHRKGAFLSEVDVGVWCGRGKKEGTSATHAGEVWRKAGTKIRSKPRATDLSDGSVKWTKMVEDFLNLSVDQMIMAASFESQLSASRYGQAWSGDWHNPAQTPRVFEAAPAFKETKRSSVVADVISACGRPSRVDQGPYGINKSKRYFWGPVYIVAVDEKSPPTAQGLDFAIMRSLNSSVEGQAVTAGVQDDRKVSAAPEEGKPNPQGQDQKRVKSRTWTDLTGTHTIEAEFVDLTDGKVQLKKTDDKVITVPIERLSEADQAFVKSAQEDGAEDKGKKASEGEARSHVSILEHDGCPVLSVDSAWRKYDDPTVEIALATKEDSAIKPLYLKSRLLDKNNAALVAAYHGLDKEGYLDTTFRVAGQPFTASAGKNSLGKQSVCVVTETEKATYAVFCELGRWADDQGILRLEFKLPLDRFSKPGAMRVWLLSKDKVIWSEAVDWRGARPQPGGAVGAAKPTDNPNEGKPNSPADKRAQPAKAANAKALGHLEATIAIVQSGGNSDYLVVTPSRKFKESELVVITFVVPGSGVAHEQVISIPQGRVDDAVKNAMELAAKTGLAITHQVNTFNNGQFDFVCEENSFGKQSVYAATNRYHAGGKQRFGSSTTYFMLPRWQTGEGNEVEIPLPQVGPGVTEPEFVPRTCSLRVWLITRDGVRLADASLDIKRE